MIIEKPNVVKALKRARLYKKSLRGKNNEKESNQNGYNWWR